MKTFFPRLLFCIVALAPFLGGRSGRAAEAPPPPTALPPLVVGITWAEQGVVAPEQAHMIDRFETELALALARTQGRPVTFQLGPLDWLLRELAAGRVDFMPGIARTPERQQSLDFSVPHSRLSTHLFVRRGNRQIVSADDLRGRRIIVVKDSYAQSWAERRGYAAQIVAVADLTEGLVKLASGEGDCLLAKQINMFAAMHATGITAIEPRGPAVPELLQDMCVAVRAGNRDLLAQLNEGLFLLKQTGELDRIYEKWLDMLEPSAAARTRLWRLVSIATGVLLGLAAAAWAAFRVQARRARARMAEIEHRVKERTEELAAAKARFEAVVANTPAGIVIHDPLDAELPGRIVDCNELTCRMHGYTKSELIGQSVNTLRREPLSRAQFAAIMAELKSGRRRHGQNLHRRKDGSPLEIEFFSTLVRLDGRDLALAVDVDVTDRLRAEAALRRTEEFQRLVLQATNDGIFDWDIATDHFSLSSRGWQLLGLGENELPGGRRDWWQRLHPDDAATAEGILQQHLAEGAPFVHTARYLHKDGTVRWLYARADTLRDAAGQPTRMIGSYTDITELKRIDEELQLTRRLRAIGELVGGIAHEFNNLLTPIMLRASLLTEQDVNKGEVTRQLAPVLDAARRAQVLTRQLLQFGRQTNPAPTPQSLADVVESMLSLVRSTIDRRIEIRTEYDPALPPVQLNATTMGQVAMNLVLNARDALLEKLAAAPPAGWQPQLTLRLAPHTGPARGAKGRLIDLAPSRWQRLSVCDNGPGIRPEIRERIFEPFFTTKEVGQGTGLGLAMVWHTVEELGGWIEVQSAFGESTQFDLYLPESTAPAAPAAPVEEPAAAPDRGSKIRRLLLVEDDELVGESLAGLLRKLGHTIVWLRTGDEAVARLLDRRVVFDALFTDLNMPGLGGEELVERVRQGGYRGKIVVLSGHITPAAEKRLRAAGVTALVQKPFEFERITTLLGELWNTSTVTTPPFGLAPATGRKA